MCSDAPAPDPRIGEAAAANAEIGQQALDFYMEQWEAGADDRAQVAEVSKEVMEQQLESANQNQEISQDYWNYQKDTFRPLEEGIVNEASDYDTPERREEEAGKAMQSVATSYDAARSNMATQAASMGINPNSGNYAAQSRQMDVSQAAQQAAVGNQARDNVELQGYARKMDAANLGRNLASNQATSAGVALNAGNSAVGNSQVAGQNAMQGAQFAGQGLSTAMQGNSSAGNLYLGQFNAQMAGHQADQQATSSMFGALGSAAGFAAGGLF